jgi:hypothetical protein
MAFDQRLLGSFPEVARGKFKPPRRNRKRLRFSAYLCTRKSCVTSFRRGMAKSFVRAPEQAARCASGGRPACSQWHLLGIAVPHGGIFQVAMVLVPLATIGLFVAADGHLGTHLMARIVSCGNALFWGRP